MKTFSLSEIYEKYLTLFNSRRTKWNHNIEFRQMRAC